MSPLNTGKVVVALAFMDKTKLESQQEINNNKTAILYVQTTI
jgi:hypothetical protein